MFWRCNLMTIALLAVLTSSGRADPLFKRKPKVDPAEQVPSLIRTLASEPDERKRAAAAEELREFDIKTFPDIIPALVEALKNDHSSSVRLDAVNTLGKLRPITPQAGYALEQAEANDNSLRVRAAAKSILIPWTVIHGYRRGQKPDAVANQTDEPPLAAPLPTPLPPKTQPKTSFTPKSTSNFDPIDEKRLPPPLMPTPSVSKTPAWKSMIPFLPTKNVKPEAKPKEELPAPRPPEPPKSPYLQQQPIRIEAPRITNEPPVAPIEAPVPPVQKVTPPAVKIETPPIITAPMIEEGPSLNPPK